MKTEQHLKEIRYKYNDKLNDLLKDFEKEYGIDLHQDSPQIIGIGLYLEQGIRRYYIILSEGKKDWNEWLSANNKYDWEYSGPY